MREHCHRASPVGSFLPSDEGENPEEQNKFTTSVGKAEGKTVVLNLAINARRREIEDGNHVAGLLPLCGIADLGKNQALILIHTEQIEEQKPRLTVL